MYPSKNPSSTQLEPMSIDDRILIDWFKANYKDITFIRKLVYDKDERRRDKLSEHVQKLKNDEFLYQQKDVVLEIWRYLVGIAIVYLKSKDDREEYHDEEDYGVESLYEFFKAFREFESLLYGAGERYRDHMSHMFSVFLLGEYLIRNTIGFEKIDVGDADLPKENGKRISASEKEAMWCIMSLTHDLGLGLERIPEISTKARDMLEKFGIINIQDLSYGLPGQPLHDFMIKFISSDLRKFDASAAGKERFITHVQSKYFLKFSEALGRNDHGMVSCLVLMKNLVYFLETDFLLDSYKPFDSDDAKQFLIRRNILRSIAAHNCENVYHLTLPNFPFLLTIFDEMQEWGRPSFSDLFEKIATTKVIVENLSDTEIHYKVKLTYRNSLTKDEEKRMKKDAHQYFQRKCAKIRRILRSAVGGQLRKLKLTFEVSNMIGDITSYKIIHETPKNVKIFKDNQEISWLQLSEQK